ncbi:ATP-binding protein [Acinetobacter sp. ANC 4648]|uniref:ATP-binding protein n=1 Tax=Acinetobacter sp. ANC 4648 TaxID=1977875 RepID=UPI000A32B4B3|nr:AAA family ATPase [Acinetobacter sp. ANC 4648]OTG84918.1 ATP-binding protein [Acinetobacter sp. ANC 4648]
MKLQFIHLKHTYHFSDLKIQFDYSNKPISLILGDQASGKTAIIKNIYQALTWLPARFKDIRTAGVIMLDQDIMLNRLQSKIDVKINFSREIGLFAENQDSQEFDASSCSWQLYKTLTSSGVGLSKVELQQLESLVELYTQASKKDPLQGFPMLAYYPSDRFINEVNLLSKNNPAVLQAHAAFELSAITYTTYARFFEWFREICDIENAQTAQLFQKIIQEKSPELSNPSHENTAQIYHELDLKKSLLQATTQPHSPCLKALKNSLQIVIPELSDLYLAYTPKLQLMVCYHNETMLYQQLSNTLKSWIALVGDIVRRLCLLNPNTPFPCTEGEGILLIDNIDAHLDAEHTAHILERLHQAFPKIQIIASGTQTELLEHSLDYQYFKLEHKTLLDVSVNNQQNNFDLIYEQLQHINKVVTSELLPITEPNELTAQQIYQQIQNLSLDQQQELQQLMIQRDNESSHEPLL